MRGIFARSFFQHFQRRFASQQPNWKHTYRLRGMTEADMQEVASWINPKDKRGWVYRRPSGEPPELEKNLALSLSAIFWCYFIYHIPHYWPMVFGEFVIPEPSDFKDAELGIPPDDLD